MKIDDTTTKLLVANSEIPSSQKREPLAFLLESKAIIKLRGFFRLTKLD